MAEAENIIGRDPHADITLQFPGVSRKHARIVIEKGEAILEDLSSKNGTLLQGHKVTEPSLLHDGDLVTVGTVVLTFRAPAPRPSTLTEANE